MLIIFDDIADSFDYKNKYAIIEYLYDLKKKNQFNILILTHNFDFYRSIVSRLQMSNKFFAVRKDDEIILQKGEYTKNVFTNWKDRIGDKKIFISAIPFMRNLIEYKDGEENADYETLTCLLHYKTSVKNGGKVTDSILVKHVKDMFKQKWNIDETKCGYNENDKMLNFIFDEANDIVTCGNVDDIHIEYKIVLSIAIRLKLEMYLISKIKDKMAVESIESNQTRELVDMYKNRGLSTPQDQDILEDVLIMTSENIHLNSFMYEPIIDMSLDHLIKLYNNVCALK